ncbi:hypothetical protein CQW23_01783 [Capsicum baccatum]|uniref:Uncharacterized protein n=1 Tax=Capsicum baccatum TaxID=33114 RepID=A0A2G2XPM0_CAPBA|nr:hypothetical protein CQW23_01783 [Capsicum baccatum]
MYWLLLKGDGNRVMDYFAWFGCIELWKVDMISNPKRREVHLGLVLKVDSQGHKPSMGRSQLICTGGSLMVTVQYSNDYKDDKNEALHTQYIFRTDVPHGDLHFMLQAQVDFYLSLFISWFFDNFDGMFSRFFWQDLRSNKNKIYPERRMGISFSCPLASPTDLENSLESVIVKSINFSDKDLKTPLRSISFKSLDSEPIVMQSDGSGNMLIEKSVSLKTKEMNQESPKSPLVDSSSSPKHEAAVRLQKVYKSFRTRRKLADCAVLIEQSWWKLLDFAQIKHSSISFFDIEKHETAISRWSRARTRAAKVGKGLSKNSKAQKLALQHWLEAIDTVMDTTCISIMFNGCILKEPFFYWLDIGEGKEVNVVDKCPRWKLQQQCIKYLGPMERKAYEVVVDEGKLFYKENGKLLDTTGEPNGAKWIFVLSTSKTLYVGKKKKGSFQHSSFLAGGATLAELIDDHQLDANSFLVLAVLKQAVWPHSGHYRPTPENFQDFISFLRENNVDLNDVKLDSTDDEEDSVGKKSDVYRRSNASDDDIAQNDDLETGEMI